MPTTERYYDPQRLRNRHLAIMEQMVGNPQLNQDQMAQKLGYTSSRFSIIVNSALFQYAFAQYRKTHMDKISDLTAEATTAALKFSKEIIENRNVDVGCRQVSARDILSQGHAKAVERRANLNVGVPLPPDALGRLESILGEVSIPFKPTRTLVVPQGGGEEDGGGE